RGADLRYNLEVTLEQAFSGSKAKIQFPTSIVCETCDGSGAKKGSKPTTCATCRGAGQVSFRQGFFQMSRTCPECGGAGQVIADKCRDCSGHGRKRHTKVLDVNIPAGVDEGTRLRLAGEGEAGAHGGESGDLFVFVSVKPHPIFKRDNLTLALDVPVGMLDAALGAEVELPTIDGGQTMLKIPAGSQPGRRFGCRGLGCQR
ncbi:MAG: molecular chaperone DnaJ, partial [Proteobacteria bacterium]|nr:molecular chaperone DnaJ [Pseudomonadota bacterium]